jgi:hypothetical protein
MHLAPPAGSRPGFFLGDGAGVGKGRQIAALVKDYWLSRSGQQRRILWVSVSADLRWVQGIAAEVVMLLPLVSTRGVASAHSCCHEPHHGIAAALLVSHSRAPDRQVQGCNRACCFTDPC